MPPKKNHPNLMRKKAKRINRFRDPTARMPRRSAPKDSWLRDDLFVTDATRSSSADCPTILHFIRELAAYEKLNHELVVTEDRLRQKLFGEHPAAEVVFGQSSDQAIGFALYLPTYSTFLAQPGIYLEDLFVDLAWARLRPARMDGARLERAGDSVLPLAWRSAYGRMDG